MNEELKKRFDNLAKEYDDVVINKADYVAYNVLGDLIIKNVKTKNPLILDLGCGTGLSSVKFFEKNFEVIGIDCSHGMISEAKKRPFKKLICQDLEKPLLVEDNHFDAVVLIGVMEFIKNPKKLFIEIKSKLKKDGIFALTVPRKMPLSSKLGIKSYTKEEIEKIFSESGFKIIKQIKLFGYSRHNEDVEYYGYLLKSN